MKNSIERLLPEPCVCQKTPSRPSRVCARSRERPHRRVDAEYLMVLGEHLDQPARALEVGDEVLDDVEQSCRARSSPRIAVSSETTPGSASSSTRFHSPKRSHAANVAPTLVSEPLERMTKAFGVKSCGIVSR